MRADESRAAGYQESHHAPSEDRRTRLITTPPAHPRSRTAIAPPSRASSDPSPEPSCAAMPRLVAPSDARGPLDGELSPERRCGSRRLSKPAPSRACEPAPLTVTGEPWERAPPMPAPNSDVDALAPAPPPPPPICRAWFRGSAYCLAAGEPGSTWTPGS